MAFAAIGLSQAAIGDVSQQTFFRKLAREVPGPAERTSQLICNSLGRVVVDDSGLSLLGDWRAGHLQDDPICPLFFSLSYNASCQVYLLKGKLKGSIHHD
jgi:hypothetical protein